MFNPFKKKQPLWPPDLKDKSWTGFQKKLELLGDMIEKKAPTIGILNIWQLCFLNSEILRRESKDKCPLNPDIKPSPRSG